MNLTDVIRKFGEEDKIEKPHGWIQWKGTDVCIDLHCTCGEHSHFDGEFFYGFECPKCGTKYVVGQYVKLLKIEGELLQIMEKEKWYQFNKPTIE